MNYLVGRSYWWDADKPPCAGARWLTTEDDPSGSWYVEISTLEELTDFTEKYGEICFDGGSIIITE